MASWTTLNNASSYTEIHLATWNALSGTDGNLQYLYDILDAYSYADYYAYSAEYNTPNFSFALHAGITEPYNIGPTSFIVDERPEDINPQFYDEDDISSIQIQKNGLYLINSYVPAINWFDSNPEAQVSMEFLADIDDEVYTLINANQTTGGSTIGERLLTPNIFEHFTIKKWSESDVIYNRVQATTSSVNVVNYDGFTNGTPFTSWYAAGPYNSALFLSVQKYNETPPSVIYYFNTLPKYVPVINSNYIDRAILEGNNPLPRFDEPPWPSINETTNIVAYGMKYVDSNFWWYSGNDGNYYIYPKALDSNGNRNSYPIWRILNAQVDKSLISYRYMLFAIKACDFFDENSPYESNIVSFVIYDTALEGLKANICTLSVVRNSLNVMDFYLRTYGKVTKITSSSLLPSDEIIVGIEFEQLFNSYILYQPKLIINNTVVAIESGDETQLIYGPSDGYEITDAYGDVYKMYTNDIQKINGTLFQGPDFYKCSSDGIRANIAMYAMGNWKLSDASSNADIVKLEKEYLWTTLQDIYNITSYGGSFTVSASTNPLNSIIIGTYTFNNTGRLL